MQANQIQQLLVLSLPICPSGGMQSGCSDGLTLGYQTFCNLLWNHTLVKDNFKKISPCSKTSVYP